MRIRAVVRGIVVAAVAVAGLTLAASPALAGVDKMQPCSPTQSIADRGW
jgi:hypothetical protein